MAKSLVLTHLPGSLSHTFLSKITWITWHTVDLNYSCLQLYSEAFCPFHTCHCNPRTDGTKDSPASDNETLQDANHYKKSTEDDDDGAGLDVRVCGKRHLLFSRTPWMKSWFLSIASSVVMYLIVSKFVRQVMFFHGF